MLYRGHRGHNARSGVADFNWSKEYYRRRLPTVARARSTTFEVSPSDSALEELVRDTKDSVRRTVSGAYAEAPSLNP